MEVSSSHIGVPIERAMVSQSVTKLWRAPVVFGSLLPRRRHIFILDFFLHFQRCDGVRKYVLAVGGQ